MARMSALTRPGSRLVNEPQWVGAMGLSNGP